MARDPIKLTIQGDDDDGLRFERWLAVMLTLCGGDSHPELVRLMMERIERGEEIRARNLGVRVTRNNVTEPTPGTIRPQGLGHHQPLEKAGWLRRSAQRFERRCTDRCKGRDQSGHSNGTVEPMEEVSWHRREGIRREMGRAARPRRIAKGVPEKSLRPWRLVSRSPTPLARFRMLGLRSATTHS